MTKQFKSSLETRQNVDGSWRTRRPTFAGALCSCLLGVIAGAIPALAQDAPSRAISLPLYGTPSVPGGMVRTDTGSITIDGPYEGSTPSEPASADPMQLSLRRAIGRAVRFNLGSVNSSNGTKLAEARRGAVRSALLPNINASLGYTGQQFNTATLGLQVPGIPRVIGPFEYVSGGAQLSQALVDLTAWRNYRAARESVEAAKLSSLDALDLVATAVAGTYLETIAAEARVASTKAQLDAAQAVYQQARDQHGAGLNAQIDVTRTHVELQTQQQRLTAAINDQAKRKIALARLIGLPAAQQIVLTDDPKFLPLNKWTLDAAVEEALTSRSDLKSTQAQLRVAKEARKSASAQRLPSLYVGAGYTVAGVNPGTSSGTFVTSATLRVPIWQGGRIQAGIDEASAVLAQRTAEYEDLRARVDADVRVAFLDLSATADLVTVAQSNTQLARDTLRQSRDRFRAGVADSVEVVQAQEALSVAELDYITSLFSNNLAKVSLARAMGRTAEHISELLQLQ